MSNTDASGEKRVTGTSERREQIIQVKRRSADGSVGSPHARVGNCQTSNQAKGHPKGWPFCFSN